jgi:hypothetical protein
VSTILGEVQLRFFPGKMIPGEGKETQKRGERAKNASLARFFEFLAKLSDLMIEDQGEDDLGPRIWA